MAIPRNHLDAIERRDTERRIRLLTERLTGEELMRAIQRYYADPESRASMDVYSADLVKGIGTVSAPDTRVSDRWLSSADRTRDRVRRADGTLAGGTRTAQTQQSGRTFGSTVNRHGDTVLNGVTVTHADGTVTTSTVAELRDRARVRRAALRVATPETQSLARHADEQRRQREYDRHRGTDAVAAAAADKLRLLRAAGMIGDQD